VTASSELGQEFRDIRCSHSESLPALLTQLRLSVLISTYQTGHLIVVAARQGRLVLTFHQFERATGIAVKPGTIAVCTRKEVWFLRSAPDIAAKLQPAGHYDACFLARTTHFTDEIQAHESAWVAGEFWIVNTLFSCLAALHPYYSFAPRWRPPFVSALRPEDRCHLNGLAVVDNQVRYVTALAETDSQAGWRAVKHNGGCLIEVPTGRLLARGLSLPHSPRVDGNQIFFLHSGQGRLDVADPGTGQVTAVAPVPGVARGSRSTAGTPSSGSPGLGRRWKECRSWPGGTSCAAVCGWSICGRGPSRPIWNSAREWKRSSTFRCCPGSCSLMFPVRRPTRIPASRCGPSRPDFW
jgi:uncharacterized protein (TIGR03032 family)